jgi:hypothetical protein
MGVTVQDCHLQCGADEPLDRADGLHIPENRQPGRGRVAAAGMLIRIMMINTLMPVKQNSFTHLIALLVLHDRSILAHATSVTGHYSSNGRYSVDRTQIVCLFLFCRVYVGINNNNNHAYAGQIEWFYTSQSPIGSC